MWTPHPAWREVPGATGAATLGVWRVDRAGTPWIIKRLQRPRTGSGSTQLDARHHSWWRREAEVASVSQTLTARCAEIWRAPYEVLDDLDRVPQVLSHGDALPKNMLRRAGERVVAVDWGQLGYNTVGADLATVFLYSAVDIDALLRAYVDGLGRTQQIDPAVVRNATIRTAALIAVSRASRAVAAKRQVDGYLRRLVRAESILAEVVATRS